MLDGPAGAVGEANGDARTSDTVGNQHRLVFEELRLHRRVRIMHRTLQRFDDLSGGILDPCSQDIVAIFDADAAPDSDMNVAVAAFLGPVIVERVHGLAIDEQLEPSGRDDA